jgi:hypothetical protein
MTSLGEAKDVTVVRINPCDSVRPMQFSQSILEDNLGVESLARAMIKHGVEAMRPASGARGVSFAAHVFHSLDADCAVDDDECEDR